METPRIIMEAEKKAAMAGTDSDVGGVTSATMPRKTVTESKLVISETNESYFENLFVGIRSGCFRITVGYRKPNNLEAYVK